MNLTIRQGIYRTTEQVRQWAVAILEGVDFDDLDDNDDSVNGYRSLVDGSTPVLKGFADPESGAVETRGRRAWRCRARNTLFEP